MSCEPNLRPVALVDRALAVGSARIGRRDACDVLSSATAGRWPTRGEQGCPRQAGLGIGETLQLGPAIRRTRPPASAARTSSTAARPRVRLRTTGDRSADLTTTAIDPAGRTRTGD